MPLKQQLASVARAGSFMRFSFARSRGGLRLSSKGLPSGRQQLSCIQTILFRVASQGLCPCDQEARGCATAIQRISVKVLLCVCPLLAESSVRAWEGDASEALEGGDSMDRGLQVEGIWVRSEQHGLRLVGGLQMVTGLDRLLVFG